MRSVYFHLANADNVGKILSQGLIPQKGQNSRIFEEPEDCVYLCDLRSIPYWDILLGYKNPVALIIRINTDNQLSSHEWKYERYKEFTTNSIIDPSCISVIDDFNSAWTNCFATNYQAIRNDVMQTLCIDYLEDISFACLSFIHLEEIGGTASDANSVIRRFRKLLTVLNRLDWNCLPQERYEKELLALGDSGAYTFVDNFYDGDKIYKAVNSFRYEKIEPEFVGALHEASQSIMNFVTETFPSCLQLNTGGYCK
mgnify:CR=1 FL=1